MNPKDQLELWDGKQTCLVDKCCKGDILLRTVHESRASRMVTFEPVLVSKSFVCKTCGKSLPSKLKPLVKGKAMAVESTMSSEREPSSRKAPKIESAPEQK